MKFVTPAFFGAIAIFGALSVVSSCTHTPNLVGAWQAAPERLDVAGAADASSTVTLDFAATTAQNTPGQVNISAVINVQQAAVSAGAGLEQPWEANVAATATATGTYVFEEGEDDDLLISIDPSTLQVVIDPDGVVYVDNALDGVESSAVDSLTATAAAHWRVVLTAAVRDQFNQYRKMEDVEIHHGTIMSAEIGHRDVTLRAVGRE